MLPTPPRSTRTDSLFTDWTLFRSVGQDDLPVGVGRNLLIGLVAPAHRAHSAIAVERGDGGRQQPRLAADAVGGACGGDPRVRPDQPRTTSDRKSTRLNSSP